jgi:enoyl-CoA hydratase
VPTDANPDILLVNVSDRIATLTLNRPQARNALSTALLKAIRSAMADADANSDVDVIILTGSDPAFSAGLDLKELGSTGGNVSAGGTTPADAPAVAIHPWAPTAKPVIGAINGVAITGGFELALNCDFLVASERASFGDTHTRVGVLPGWGLSVLLPQAIGLRRSIEMSLTGNFISAPEAMRLGLVNHVVSHDELLPTARKLAADIVQNSQEAARELLASYRAIHRMTVGDGEVHEAEVGRNWLRRTFHPEEVEARRAAIVERGRAQV